MKKAVKSCLIGALVLGSLCIAGVVIMFLVNFCPPQGPWPMPPWCGNNSHVTFDFTPVPLVTIVPTQEEISIENAIVVSTDIKAINYPFIYNNPTFATAHVEDPYCALQTDQVAYPAEYLGENEYPKIGGAPLPADIMRVAGIKDVWIQEPNLNNCDYSVPYEKMRESYDITLERVLALGADQITFTNYIAFVNSETAELQPPEMAATNHDDLRYIAKRADAKGLDLVLYLNLAPGNETVSQEIPSKEWLGTLINNWEPFVLDQARLAEETGMAAIMINHYDYQPIIKGAEEVYQTEYLELLANTRKVYSGRILFAIEPTWGADLGKLDALLSTVDGFIYAPIPTPLRNAGDKTVSVDNLKRYYLENLNGIGGDFRKFNKSYFVRILIQSEKDFLENGWNEDMFCLPRDGNPCYQKNLEVDFSLQAIAYEALLEAIAQVDKNQVMNVDSVETNGYWFTDVMLPYYSQPQIAQSVRNKPAEMVLYEWFKR